MGRIQYIRELSNWFQGQRSNPSTCSSRLTTDEGVERQTEVLSRSRCDAAGDRKSVV
jgi:hypothetical protein